MGLQIVGKGSGVAIQGRLCLKGLMKPQHLPVLTSLRFFAAASVVIAHMLQPIMLAPYPGMPQLALGVSFFFVLSGFILTYANADGINIKRFYYGRFARLWPVHLATGLLAFAFLTPFLLERPEWHLPILTNILLLQAWVPITGYPFTLNSVSWSISAELFFYLCFPFMRGRYFWWALSAAVALTFVGLAAVEIANASPDIQPLWNFSARHWVLQHPFMRVLEFTVGVGFGRLFLRRKVKAGTVLEIIAVSAVIGFGTVSNASKDILIALGLPHVGFWFAQTGGMLFMGAGIFIFAHQQGAVSKALMNPILVSLGKVSFSTYMVHQIIIKLAAGASWPDELGVVTASILVLGAIYAGSYVSWFIFEKWAYSALTGRNRTSGRHVIKKASTGSRA